MIAMKFGGSSVGSGERMVGVAKIIQSYISKKPVVVISAIQGVTDSILSLSDDFLNRRKEEGQKKLNQLGEKHFEIIREYIKDSKRASDIRKKIEELMCQLEEVAHGVYLLRELSPKSLALVSSFGERLSVPLLSGILQEMGIPAKDFDARNLVSTDNDFLSAGVDMKITCSQFKKHVFPVWKKGVVPIITGFIGSCRKGLTTTLGRGGSDYSGAIVGACFDAEEIWIWTDVSGIYSADPRIVPNAKGLSSVSYEEASEMSYFGAKVIHPKTMMPAVMKKIPIRIKNTFAPKDPGTLIFEKKMTKCHPVRVVTAIKKLDLVSVQGSGMIGVPSISARIFSTVDRAKVHLFMYSQASSGYNMCLVTGHHESHRLKEMLECEFDHELKIGALDQIGIFSPMSIVSVIGSGMRGTPGIAGTFFSAIGEHGLNIMAIAQGSSQLNISMVIEERDADLAVKILHDAFKLSQ